VSKSSLSRPTADDGTDSRRLAPRDDNASVTPPSRTFAYWRCEVVSVADTGITGRLKIGGQWRAGPVVSTTTLRAALRAGVAKPGRSA